MPLILTAYQISSLLGAATKGQKIHIACISGKDKNRWSYAILPGKIREILYFPLQAVIEWPAGCSSILHQSPKENGEWVILASRVIEISLEPKQACLQ